MALLVVPSSRIARLAAIALLSSLPLGCGGRGPRNAPDSSDGGSSADAGPATSIQGAATDGTLTQSYGVTINGHGAGPFGQLTISGNVGTVVYQGRSVPAVVYEEIPFPAANNQTLYQVLAVDVDRWIVAWAYCGSGRLTTIWYETTDGTAGTFENATGNCSSDAIVTDSLVRFDAFDLPFPALVSGFSIDGANVRFDGMHPGTATFGSKDWTFHPFGQVDCSMDCGTPAWWELHSVLVDESTGRNCFGIFYLSEDVTNEVQLSYMLCLPTLDDPTGGSEYFEATSSHP